MDLGIADRQNDASAPSTTDAIATLVQQTAAEASGHVQHWLNAARTCREAGRLSEAEALLLAAAEHFPDEPRVCFDYARVAESRRDWTAAQARWAAASQRFPERQDGLVGQGWALHEQGRSEEGRALLIQALEQFPNGQTPLHLLARLSETTRNWTAAERWWRVWLAVEPRAFRDYARLANAVREQGRRAAADQILTAQFDRFPAEPALFLDYARLAERSGDWAVAEQRYGDVVVRFPDVWDGYAGQVKMLRAQGKQEQARESLEAAAARFPNATGPSHDLAQLARERRDWPAAEHWWRACIGIDPKPVWAHTGLAEALRQQKRHDDAAALLLALVRQRPQEQAFAAEYARLAEHLRDWAAAEQRWSEMIARFPDAWMAYLGHAHAVHAQGDERRFDEADRLYRSAQARFPGRGELLSRWVLFRVWNVKHVFEFPLSELESLVDAFSAAVPADAGMMRCKASLRRAVGDAKTAIEVLATAGRLFPNDRGIVSDLAAMQDLLVDQEVDSDPARLRQIEDHSRGVAPLFARFESLGGGGPKEVGWGHGCEFGLVQRSFGAEPIGLLRWATVGPRGLIAALNARFADVGDPANIAVRPMQNGEWAAAETKYNFDFWHTQLLRSQVPEDAARQRIAGRIRFLARKLVEDLALGDKIFVYRLFGRPLDEDLVSELHKAIQAYGNSTLLFVTYADESHPAGTVAQTKPGLLLGYIDWFSAERDNHPDNVEGWKKICEAAVQRIQA